MTKDVIVTIQGLQFIQEDAEAEPVEVVTPGEYYKKNGNHYIMFDEATEGFDQTTHNVMKFREDSLEVRKKGLVNVQMFFQAGKKTVSFYQTPFGMMNMGISTTGLRLTETLDNIDFHVDYALDLNDGAAVDCRIHMNIRQRENFHLNV